MSRTAVPVLVGALALLGACDGDDSESSVATTANSEPIPAPSADDDGDTGALDRDATCQEFYDLLGEFTLTDEESAAAYYALAGRTMDADLAAAIGRIADGFARSDEEILSTELAALCA